MNDFFSKETNYFHIHIPKTGGTTLNSVFDKYSWFTNGGHCFFNNTFPHVGVTNTEGKKWANYQDNGYTDGMARIAVVRNPFSWLWSYYNHEGRTHFRLFKHSGWQGCNDYHKFRSFNEFINYYLDDDNYWHVPPLQKSPLGQIKNGNKLEVDCLVYNEYLNDFIQMLANSKGISLENIQNENRGKKNRTDYRSFYTSNQIDAVYKKFSDFFQITDYTFDGFNVKPNGPMIRMPK
ncbi:sulfotransferase family 2 domain-containing protein [Vibrio splendidus]